MPFKITIPVSPTCPAVKMPDGVIGALAQASITMANTMQTTKWFIQAKLDVPRGFDLSKRVQINVA